MKKLFLNYFVVATFLLSVNALMLVYFTFSTPISDSINEEEEQVILIQEKTD